MDFGFNDEYKMIQKMYREFAEKEIKPLAAVSYTHLTLPTIRLV